MINKKVMMLCPIISLDQRPAFDDICRESTRCHGDAHKSPSNTMTNNRIENQYRNTCLFLKTKIMKKKNRNKWEHVKEGRLKRR